MTSIHPAYEARQRARFLRPDAERFMRPDAARFARPDAWRWLAPQAARAERKYRPDQPRVPAGNPDGGQWTDEYGAGGRGGGLTDPRVVSDADPQNDWVPGARYAQNRGRSVGARFPDATPAQQTRLIVSEANAGAAAAAVRRIDPFWREPAELTAPGSIQGAIASAEGRLADATRRLDVLNRLGLTPESFRPNAPVLPIDALMPRGPQLDMRSFGGRKGDVYRFPSSEFDNLRDGLLNGARAVEPRPTYQGMWFERSDGTRFGLRWSRDHGPTIDIFRSESTLFPPKTKVHRR